MFSRKTGKLRPYFERKSGTVTVGNACPITDGGSAVLLASAEAVKKYALEPMARVVDVQFSGLEPERMGMGLYAPWIKFYQKLRCP